MPHTEDLNKFLSQNPGDAYHEMFNAGQLSPQEPDPMAQAGADGAVQPPAQSYGGLTGDPYQTAIITTAQLDALRPRQRPRPRRPAPQPFAGLSSYLGA